MQGCRAAQKDVADTGGCPPSRCPLAFNNSTETQNAACASPPLLGRVTVGGCGLGLATPADYHQRGEAAALLVPTKLELNKSCVAAGVTTTPVNCDVPPFNCTSCVVIPECIISVCICVCLCCSTQLHLPAKFHFQANWADLLSGSSLCGTTQPDR